MTLEAAPAPTQEPGAVEPRQRVVAPLACAGLMAGILAASAPVASVLVAVLVLVVVAVVARPVWAAYLLLGLTPLLAGIDRGAAIPLLRPHEALAVLLGGAVALRVLSLALTGRRSVIRLHPLDWTLVLLAATASVLPVLWLVVRGKALSGDDLQHSLVLWKYFGLYVLVRASVRTPAQVARCLVISLVATSVVAVVAILQSLQLFGVPELLASHYAPMGNERALAINRGTSTLASSIAVGDVMTFCLAITLTWLLRGNSHRVALLAMSGLFAVGALGSGQFSGVIALGVGVVAVGWVTGRLGKALGAALPAAALGGLLLQPVIARRLSGFDSREGLPNSWIGRLDNLQTFFWPELFRDGNFLLGVRPSARVPAPETWRSFVYIESGHTWLLWAGGIPLLIAFFVFLWVALRTTARTARSREDAVGVAGAAAFTAVCVVGVLMTLDLHLTLRGAADLLFSLLALSMVGHGSTPPPPRQPRDGDERDRARRPGLGCGR